MKHGTIDNVSTTLLSLESAINHTDIYDKPHPKIIITGSTAGRLCHPIIIRARGMAFAVPRNGPLQLKIYRRIGSCNAKSAQVIIKFHQAERANTYVVKSCGKQTKSGSLYAGIWIKLVLSPCRSPMPGRSRNPI